MPSRPSDWLRDRPAVFWLLVVAVVFVVVQVVFVPLDMFLSWDEAVYASQHSSTVREVDMSAHRSPGVPLLLAPVTLVTGSTVVIRGFLTVVSAVALFLAYRPWVRVDTTAAVLGALLFAVSGVVVMNAHQALPNVLTALATVAAVGCFAAAGRDADADSGGRRPWRALAGVVVAFAVASLLRPTDAVFVAAPLFAATVLVRRWRRIELPVAVFAGLGVGGVAWLVEALVDFGGPFERLAAMRDTTAAGSDPVALQWLADAASFADASPGLAVLAVACGVALVAAVVLLVRRVCGGWPDPVWLLALVTACTVAAPYYLLLSFTSDRYLIPVKGLLALVAAAAAHRLATAWTGRLGAAVAAVSAVAVLAYATVQLVGVAAEARGVTRVREAREGYTVRLANLGVQPPCVISGTQAPAYAYELGCTSGDILAPVPNPEAQRRALARDTATARREGAVHVVMLSGDSHPEQLDGWHRVLLDRKRVAYAYFAPSDT